LGFGGAFHGNAVSVSVSHSVLFFALAGFQSVTSIQVSFRIPRTDAAVNFATTLNPSGKTLYTGYANDFIYGNSAAFSGQHRTRSIGKYLIRGTVRFPDGEPIEGAAVQVAKTLLYTDSRGEFSLRTNRLRAYAIEVLPAEFTAPGRWHIVSAPEQALSLPEGSDGQIKIICENK